MDKPLSTDLRSRLVAAVSRYLPYHFSAERFGVSMASVVRWVHACHTTGSVCAKPQGGDTRSYHIEAFSDVILTAVEAQKDISLVELADLRQTKHGVSFAASTVWRFLDRHAMTFKRIAHAAEQERPDVAAQRRAWFAAQPDLNPLRLVFIDETSASTKMARLRGRAQRGQRCFATAPTPRPGTRSRRRLSTSPNPGRSLQDPYRADRQRNPLHNAWEYLLCRCGDQMSDPKR